MTAFGNPRGEWTLAITTGIDRTLPMFTANLKTAFGHGHMAKLAGCQVIARLSAGRTSNGKVAVMVPSGRAGSRNAAGDLVGPSTVRWSQLLKIFVRGEGRSQSRSIVRLLTIRELPW